MLFRSRARALLREQLDSALYGYARYYGYYCYYTTPFTTLCRKRQVISRIALLRERQGGCGREHLHRAVLHHHGPLHPPQAVCQHQLAVLHLLEAVFLLQ